MIVLNNWDLIQWRLKLVVSRQVWLWLSEMIPTYQLRSEEVTLGMPYEKWSKYSKIIYECVLKYSGPIEKYFIFWDKKLIFST